MRSRNTPRKPTLGPFGTCCLSRQQAIAGQALHHSEHIPTSRPFLAYWGETLLWWKLTRPMRNGFSDGPENIRGLLWSGSSSRTWSWVNFCLYDTPAGGKHWCGDEAFLELLDEAAFDQEEERLERRAKDARKRRAADRTAHKPIRCACCGEKFTPKRTDAKCCSAKCRAKLSRQKQKSC